MNFFQRRKLARSAMKTLEAQIKAQMEREIALNNLIKTENFVEVIRELINNAVDGAEVTVVLNSGHKIEIKPSRGKFVAAPDMDLPGSVWG